MAETETEQSAVLQALQDRIDKLEDQILTKDKKRLFSSPARHASLLPSFSLSHISVFPNHPFSTQAGAAVAGQQRLEAAQAAWRRQRESQGALDTMLGICFLFLFVLFFWGVIVLVVAIIVIHVFFSLSHWLQMIS